MINSTYYNIILFDKTFSTKQSIYTIIFLEKVKSKIYTQKNKNYTIINIIYLFASVFIILFNILLL